MINWNDCTPLTKEEFDNFINAAIPHLKDMEKKNRWDFFMNDMSIKQFCEMFIMHAFSLNPYEEYQKRNTKVQDVLAIYNMLLETDWTSADETLQKYKNVEIWALVINKVDDVATVIL